MGDKKMKMFMHHDDCQDQVWLYMECHRLNPKLKYLGACNPEKDDLDMCNRSERLRKAKENLEKSRARGRGKAELGEKWDQLIQHKDEWAKIMKDKEKK